MDCGKHQTWFIPDMFWPKTETGGAYTSHEAICVLNANGQDAQISLDLYFEDREPLSGFEVCCKAARTNHIRMDKLTNSSGVAVPQGTPYAAIVRSNIPVVVQYTRVDTTPMPFSLMTTMAYPT
jgi:hypothetical protein